MANNSHQYQQNQHSSLTSTHCTCLKKVLKGQIETCDRSVVSSTNKTDRHDITEILLKVVINVVITPNPFNCDYYPCSLTFISMVIVHV
jgi:hypothetical protein